MLSSDERRYSCKSTGSHAVLIHMAYCKAFISECYFKRVFRPLFNLFAAGSTG